MRPIDLPIIDLHCDLLSYLNEKPGRTPHDAAARCSYPQLVQGKVKAQTVAIFAKTGPLSVEKGKGQVLHLQALMREHPTSFIPYRSPLDMNSSCIHLLPAFESASSFSDEQEPLDESLKRLASYIALLGPIFYISMTWDGENRFGGGTGTSIGLKPDGKSLLEWLDGKKIAIDLSHASDHLAHDIINTIDRLSLNIPLIASHSNFRTITLMERNLPDDIAREIIQRKGLIGLNFFAPFIRKNDPTVLMRHVEYALYLGGKETLSFGADFFSDDDPLYFQKKYGIDQPFFSHYSNASVYPEVLKLLFHSLHLNTEILENLSYKNALRFLEKQSSCLK